jgi:hypothetical protein
MDETNHPPRKRHYVLLGGLAGLLFATILFVIAPMVVRSRKDFGLVQAHNNARQIGLALLEFEQSYGTFPNDNTSPQVTANTDSALLLGSKTSNDIFRQLIAAEITQCEEMFYARIHKSRKPDNLITGSQALEKGECGFSYLHGASKHSPPETPIVVTPLVPGKALFDYKGAKKPFYGKAVILRYDGSVQSLPIEKSGHVLINGKDLFDPTQPFWNGKPSTIKWPDL